MSTLSILLKTLLFFEALSAIAGFLTWRKWKDNYLKWFPVYLAVISFMEISYYILGKMQLREQASAVQQVAVLTEIIFISWLFYQMLPPKQRVITIIGATVYIATLMLEKLLLKDTHYYFRSLSYTTGTLFILLYLILFFVNLARSELILGFIKLTRFWLASGMLLFYLGTFPFYGLYNELARDLDLFKPLAIASLALNHMMYSLFVIGFVWGKPR